MNGSSKLKKFISPLSKTHKEFNLGRIRFVLVCLVLCFSIIIGRLVKYSFDKEDLDLYPEFDHDVSARPDILDRNGFLLATDIRTYSLCANPKRILNVKETIELLATVLPNLNKKDLYKKLTSKASFVWIERGLIPLQKYKILNLGIPGISFRTEIRRFYPSGNNLSHVVGFVDIDNHGISGIEKYIDENGLSVLRASGLINEKELKPIKLSLDLRVQSIVHSVVEKAKNKYHALAAATVILNVKNGEIISLVSVPDYDPNKPKDALLADRLNRMTAGVYEMGSTIKSFTTAMVLDTDRFDLNSFFDASKPIAYGHQMIHDFHGKYRPLKLWEVFIYSSNIGSVKEAEAVGIPYQKAFLQRLGLLDKLQTELPELASPIYPAVWKTIHSATISFGHGLATTPLQTAVGNAALVNGGYWIPPTFLLRKQERANTLAKKVIKTSTSDKMRYLDWLNGQIGSGKLARVLGYRVGGKTGTAEKVIDGKYSRDHRFNAYLASFPIEDPRYVVLTIIDDPQTVGTDHSAVAAYNAGRMANEIIKRSAFYLGINPNFYIEQRFPSEEDKYNEVK